MGNSQSSSKIKPFGSVNAKDGEPARPGYYITRFGVKYKGETIPPLQGETQFNKLNYGYATSNIRVFFNGKPISDADPKSFTIIPRNLVAKDPRFQKLNCVLGKDVKNGKVRWYKFGTKFYEE